MCCGLYAIDTVAHFNGIEIHFHDAFLAPDVLDEEGEVGLQAFAHPAVAWPQEHILGRLLADGAGATLAFALLSLDLGLLNLLQVKALVL